MLINGRGLFCINISSVSSYKAGSGQYEVEGGVLNDPNRSLEYRPVIMNSIDAKSVTELRMHIANVSDSSFRLDP
jgi:hypothetical protein